MNELIQRLTQLEDEYSHPDLAHFEAVQEGLELARQVVEDYCKNEQLSVGCIKILMTAHEIEVVAKAVYWAWLMRVREFEDYRKTDGELSFEPETYELLAGDSVGLSAFHHRLTGKHLYTVYKEGENE